MSYDFSNSLMHQFHRCSQLADELFASKANDLKLTPRQFVVLAAAAGNDGLSQTQIVKITGIDRSTIADIVLRMIKSGLISRRRTKDDARAYAVKITDQGREALKVSEAIARKVDDTLMEKLTPVGREEFRKLLAAVSNESFDD